MKYIPATDMTMAVMEVTERNLKTLLEKLRDPNSQRTLLDPEMNIAIRAVDNSEHYKTRAPGITLTNGEYK